MTAMLLPAGSINRQGGSPQRGAGSEPTRANAPGVVYTQEWTVNLMLDLAGYKAELDLTNGLIVDPCCGTGAFLIKIVERLLESAERLGVPLRDLAQCVRAYEIDPAAAAVARAAVEGTLVAAGANESTVTVLLDQWILVSDFLLAPPGAETATWVVGNPPYVRIEQIDPSLISAYRAEWPIMTRRADLYMGFFGAAMQSLTAAGTLVFIAPDRWMRNQYGEPLRELLSGEFSLELVVELHAADAFVRRVAAYPAISLIRRGADTSTRVVRVDESFTPEHKGELLEVLQSASYTPERAGIRRSEILRTGAQRWALASGEGIEILRRWEETLSPLEVTGAVVRAGVATGADRIFVTTDSELVESSALIRLVGPADVSTGELKWQGRYLISPWAGETLQTLNGDRPKLTNYLRANETALRDRYVARRNPEAWWRTIDRPTPRHWAHSKLLIADINHRIEPVLAGPEYIPLNTLFYVTSTTWDLEVLGGLLMSDLVHKAVGAYSVAMSSGSMRLSAQYLRLIRLPKPVEISASSASQLVEAFRSRDRKLASHVGKQLLA